MKERISRFFTVCSTYSERPKQLKSVSAETEISAKLTEASAEISAETVPKRSKKLREIGFLFLHFCLNILGLLCVLKIQMNLNYFMWHLIKEK